MSQLSSADGHERPGPSTVVPSSGVSGSGTGVASSGSVTVTSGSASAGSSSVSAGSVSVTPPPPAVPQPAVDRRAQTVTRAAVALVDDELGPSLTSAQLMRSPVTERLLPDLSVSNEALLNSLRPAAENTLSLRASRLARSQSDRALYWFGTRPRWLQATLSVVGGSVVGLSLVVAYAKAFHSPPEPELAAEPTPSARAMALAAAAPAALIAQRVVQPLAPAASVPAPAKAAPAAAVADAPSSAEASEQEQETTADEEQSEARKPSRRQRASKAASSGKLPAWVQQQVKPQVQRAAAREKKAAAREKRAAAQREKKARRARAKAREQE